jgi:GTP-binding protein HflX|tara:strand:- start:4989 stop:6284 length:1296 start_codon:yes stop_codon:yes gene_type:complete
MHSNLYIKPKAVIVNVDLFAVNKSQSSLDSINEFKELANSSGAEIVSYVMAKLDRPTANLFLKLGKANEIKQLVTDRCAELVIINHTLSPSQERNLEEFLGARVLDRTGLILHIFATRASSHVGKLQVELAQLTHLSTRLVRGWSHLERQKGGIGLRGPGETQLETDRRLVGQRIKTVKKKLDKTHKQKEVNRYSRKKSRNKLAAFVGYTNVGKTTLFNLLTDNLLYAADKPFATLDSVTRRNAIPELGSILFSDTVGFISDLPTQLIESFKATLDELKSADLLIHVIDISDKDFRFKTKQVLELLEELNLSHIPLLKVNNKSDKAKIEGYENLSKPEESEVWISAEEETGISHLIKSINLSLRGGIYRGWVSMNPSLGDIRSKLYSSRSVIDETTSKSGLLQLKLEIGNDELLELKSLNGFDLLDNKITI